MTRIEHLLVILAEECNEVAQRASKALRFGLCEVQSGQSETNAARLSYEVAHIFAAVDMLILCGAIERPTLEQTLAKRGAVERFLRYSAKCGTLEGEATP